LAVIAFIFALVGFLNAFLSLRSRYKDWRGIQNKKAYIRRLKELETLVNTTGIYRTEPKRYFHVVIDFIATILIQSLEACFCFVCAFIFINFLTSNLPLIVSSLAGSLMCLVFAIIHAHRLLWLARYVHVPGILKDNVVDFITRGAKKGLIPEKEGKAMVGLLFHFNMLTAGEHEQVKELVDNSTKPQE
jgi:hypothetical protein